MVRLQHPSYKEGLKSWACVVWRRLLRGDLINSYRYLKRGVKRTEPDSFQQCSAIRQRAIGTKLNRKLHLNIRKNFFVGNRRLKQVAQRGCSLISWIYSKPIWT